MTLLKHAAIVSELEHHGCKVSAVYIVEAPSPGEALRYAHALEPTFGAPAIHYPNDRYFAIGTDVIVNYPCPDIDKEVQL